MNIPVYDLKRMGAYTMAADILRRAAEFILDMHKNGLGINIHMKKAESMEMLLELIHENPRPLLDWMAGDGLKMIKLEELPPKGKSKKKQYKYRWPESVYKDTRP